MRHAGRISEKDPPETEHHSHDPGTTAGKPHVMLVSLSVWCGVVVDQYS